MKFFIIFFLSASCAYAGESIKMSFNNEELTKIITAYANATGQKFVIDPSVRGRATLLLPTPVSKEEAFNQLSSALAINGFAISTQGDTMVIKSARNIQRDLIEVSSEKPSLKPERMYTWIYTFKYISAEEVNRELRIFPSKDGEMVPVPSKNQLIITDWASNLNRIAQIIDKIDIPAESNKYPKPTK